MRTKTTKRSYHGMILLSNFEERFEYLRLAGVVNEETFGVVRYLNQQFYHTSREWKSVRERVIIRDNGCDLGDPNRPIYDRIVIHHIEPVTIEDLENGAERLLDMDNLVCVSQNTHNAIHYGDIFTVRNVEHERKPNDTIPWR